MICRHCGEKFPSRMIINGEMRTFQNRKFCLKCSPFGCRNTKSSLSDGFAVTRTIQSDSLTEKKCANCKIVKPISSFYCRKERKDYFNYCKECANILTIIRYQKNKTDAVNYKGGACIKCGYNKCVDCLEFHHIDPMEKDFTISHHKGKTLDSIKSELDKCVLLCKNCHGEQHHKMRNHSD